MVAYIWLGFFPLFNGAFILLLKLTGTVAVVGIFAISGCMLAITSPSNS